MEKNIEQSNLEEMRRLTYAEHLALTQTIERVAESVSLKLIAKGHICAKDDIINILIKNIDIFQDSVNAIKGLSEAHRLEIKADLKELQTAIMDAAAENRHLDEERKKNFDKHLIELYKRNEALSYKYSELSRKVKLYIGLVIGITMAAVSSIWTLIVWGYPEFKAGWIAAIEQVHKTWK